MWFELSWRAVAGRWIRPDLEPDTDELMEDSYVLDDGCVHILSPEDNLLQVCIHTAKHSYLRAPGLRLHLDVDRIVSHKKIDWELFLKKVEKTHVKTACYFSLLIPSTLFGTPVPSDVLEKLKPNSRKEKAITTAIVNAGLLHPNEEKFSKLAFLKFQTALYDSVWDMCKVLYPSFGWYRERYNFQSPLLVPIYIVVRGLDLVGIRISKNKVTK